METQPTVSHFFPWILFKLPPPLNSFQCWHTMFNFWVVGEIRLLFGSRSVVTWCHHLQHHCRRCRRRRRCRDPLPRAPGERVRSRLGEVEMKQRRLKRIVRYLGRRVEVKESSRSGTNDRSQVSVPPKKKSDDSFENDSEEFRPNDLYLRDRLMQLACTKLDRFVEEPAVARLLQNATAYWRMRAHGWVSQTEVWTFPFVFWGSTSSGSKSSDYEMLKWLIAP